MHQKRLVFSCHFLSNFPGRGDSNVRRYLHHHGCPERINESICRLDLRVVNDYLTAATRSVDDLGFEACDASLEDWIHFVKSENLALRSRAMSFVNGKIYIVELPGRVHEITNEILKNLMVDGVNGGTHAGSTYVDAMVHIEPDVGFFPTTDSGAILRQGLLWGENQTFKVEVGVSRRWTQLYNKAQVWSHFPGVQYILCLHISPQHNSRSYRLFSVADNAIEQPEMLATDIVDPTPVRFDSHRLLGLPTNAPLPVNFPQPEVVLDLWRVLDRLALWQ